MGFFDTLDFREFAEVRSLGSPKFVRVGNSEQKMRMQSFGVMTDFSAPDRSVQVVVLWRPPWDGEVYYSVVNPPAKSGVWDLRFTWRNVYWTRRTVGFVLLLLSTNRTMAPHHCEVVAML